MRTFPHIFTRPIGFGIAALMLSSLACATETNTMIHMKSLSATMPITFPIPTPTLTHRTAPASTLFEFDGGAFTKLSGLSVQKSKGYVSQLKSEECVPGPATDCAPSNRGAKSLLNATLAMRSDSERGERTRKEKTEVKPIVKPEIPADKRPLTRDDAIQNACFNGGKSMLDKEYCDALRR